MSLTKDLAREAIRLDRDALRWGWAIRNAAVIGVTFAIGFAIGHTDWGFFASIGAFSTGFGDIGLKLSRRLQSMLTCTAAAGGSAFVAAVTGDSDVLAVLAMAAWGAAFGLLMALGPVESMVGRLAALTLILLADDPSSPERALEIAAVVTIGGLMQTAAAVIPTAIAATDESPVPAGQRIGAIRHAASWKDPIGRHAIRMALALSAAVLFYRVVPVGHGIWVPITVLFVLQPDPHQTEFKLFERIVGTLSGIVLVTLLVAATEPSDQVMAAFATLFAVPTYAFLRPNYALFSASIAAFVVLLVSISGVPEVDAAGYRAIDTLIGGALVIAVTLLIPMPRKVRTT